MRTRRCAALTFEYIENNSVIFMTFTETQRLFSLIKQSKRLNANSGLAFLFATSLGVQHAKKLLSCISCSAAILPLCFCFTNNCYSQKSPWHVFWLGHRINSLHISILYSNADRKVSSDFQLWFLVVLTSLWRNSDCSWHGTVEKAFSRKRNLRISDGKFSQKRARLCRFLFINSRYCLGFIPSVLFF
jgi:hypothetical protein